MSDNENNKASKVAVGVLKPPAAVSVALSIVEVYAAPPVMVVHDHTSSLQAPIPGGAVAPVEVSVAGISGFYCLLITFLTCSG